MFSSVSTSLLWRGILAVVVGVISVAGPDITVYAFVLLFAVYAFLAVGADALRAFSIVYGVYAIVLSATTRHLQVTARRLTSSKRFAGSVRRQADRSRLSGMEYPATKDR